MKIIEKQIFRFIVVSGSGWLMDFVIYTFLASIIGLNVMHSNLISTIPAFTFVFFISTKKIFKNNIHFFSLYQKYMFYFAYQFLLVFLISVFGQWLFEQLLPFFSSVGINSNVSKFYIKVLITPITITCNFIVMKILTEKL